MLFPLHLLKYNLKRILQKNLLSLFLFSLCWAPEHLRASSPNRPTGDLQFHNIITPPHKELFTVFHFHDVPESIKGDLIQPVSSLKCGPVVSGPYLIGAERYKLVVLPEHPLHAAGTLAFSISSQDFKFFNAVYNAPNSRHFVCGINGIEYNYLVEIEFKEKRIYMSDQETVACQPWSASIYFNTLWYKISKEAGGEPKLVPIGADPT